MKFFFIFLFYANHCLEFYSNTWLLRLKNDDHKTLNIVKKQGFQVLKKFNYGDSHLKPLYLIEHPYIPEREIFPSKISKILEKHENVHSITQQKILDRQKRGFIPNDPFFSDMWYLHNIGQSSGPAGVDINILPVWEQNITGKGIVISVLDDGIDYTHPDLFENYDPKASYDFNDHDDDPKPRDEDPENCHGTRCAGEAVALANNGICGVGVAFGAKIGGVRMLDGSATDALEASSLSFKPDYIDIYINCWGPKDDGKTFGKPGPLAAQSLKEGAEKGRKGLGSLFVWATGNGGLTDDDCNCDGYTTSIYTISIGCIGDHGLSAYYTEKCSSTIAVTFNGASHREGKENKMVTTDLYHKCTTEFKGTSASAPIAAGILALVLEANPRLGWRDVQHLIVKTAKITSPLDEGWKTNGAGYHYNHKFGFGRLDAYSLVEAAKKWINVGKHKECNGFSQSKEISIPINSNVTAEFFTNACQDDKDAVFNVEHVVLSVSLIHKRRGDLSISLTSPSGAISPMLSTRRYDNSDEGLDDWRFMTVHYWGENPKGKWKLIVSDHSQNDKTLTDQVDNEDIAEKLIDTQKEKQQNYVDSILKSDKNYNFAYPEGVKRNKVVRDNVKRTKLSRLPHLLPYKEEWAFLRKALMGKSRNTDVKGTQRVQVNAGYENSKIDCKNGVNCSGILLKWKLIFYGT